ncbi:hypothetical protein BDZ89DRAFT_1113537 [Hymenopellis radicata]|nr:hypothetical protein BDZ89DRAFT_1113537 [Hymenopellis radicata]
MRSQLLQIMRTVYQSRGLPSPPAIDPWWHCPEIRYCVEDSDAAQPKVCIINLGEGEPDQPSIRAHFMINLNIMRVTDKFMDEKFAAPNEIHDLLTEVRAYAVSEFNNRKSATERARRQREEREAQASREEAEAVQKFHRKLIETDLMSEEHIQDVLDRYPLINFCPLCANSSTSEHPSKLSPCSGCRSLCCLSESCKAHSIDAPKFCAEHPSVVFCKSCIGDGEELRLRPCPVEHCHRWTCSRDWCPGEPVEETKPDADSSGPPRKKVKREAQSAHTRRLAPCSSCLQSSLDWTKCDSGRCWSSSGAICPDCSLNGGSECEAGHMWICDSCTSKKHPVVWACPSCETLVCEKCPDVTRCAGCSKSEACANCQEDEDDRRFQWACEGCGARLCDSCSSSSGNDHSTTCNGCSKEFCNDCSSDVCAQCEGSLCDSCRSECSCGGVADSVMEEMAAEAMYGGYDEY